MSAGISSVDHDQGYDLFLSYNSKDREIVLKIWAKLCQFGITSFLDVEKLTPGLPWRKELERAIPQVRAAAIFFGPHGLGQTQEAEKDILLSREEAETKGGGRFPIVPIILPGGPAELDGFLSRYTWIDLRGGIEDEAAIKRLAAAVAPHASQSQIQLLRKLELDYLDRLQAEEELNQERQTQLFTKLEGRAQKRRPEVRAAFERRSAREGEPLPPKPVDDATAELLDMHQAVLLGEPGSGKTTTLCLLAVNLLDAARQNPQAQLPLLIRLGRWTDAEQPLSAFIAAQLGELGAHLETLLKNKRAALLLDGLNELPVNQRASKYPQVQKFIQKHKEAHKELLAVVSCRALDYTLDLKFDTINILPLDPVRIREFVKRDLGDELGEQMFWKLAGGETQQIYHEFMQKFSGQLTDPEQTFWNEPQLPPGVYWRSKWSSEKTNNGEWERWLRLRETPSSLMLMARNPYLLSMLDAEFADAGKLPDNRGDLFRAFVNRLLKREREFLKEEAEHDALQREQNALIPLLAKLACEMQNRSIDNKQGDVVTALPKVETMQILDERQLYLAGNASLLTVSDPVRFSHQLLQEYFAAQFLDLEFRAGTLDAQRLWPRDRWWERTNREESAVLWAGLYTDNCTDVVTWLATANPEVAAQCVVRSGSYTPDATKANLRASWTPRLGDLRSEPNPLARAAVGRALGLIGDNRPGVGVINGLPDIDWVEVSGGKFQYGDDLEKIDLPTFWISRYPITYAQFQAFLDDPHGIQDARWFEGLAASDDDQRMAEQHFKYYEHPYTNHPRETVNWYQAMAFCRWLSWHYGGGYDLQKIDAWKVRLPTEFEWEKAACGTDGREYPYGKKFDPAKGNTQETGIRQTNAVGIFPNGASPYDVMEMSGNVWEWCLSNSDTPTHSAKQEDLRTEQRRVLRGGSWFHGSVAARAVSRSINVRPSALDDILGFRVSCVGRPPSF